MSTATMAAPPGARRLHTLRCQGGVPREAGDDVADEVPVALQYNGISHAVMLATPLDLEDFAYGFSLSEGLVDRADEVHDVEVEPVATGIVLHVEIASRCLARLKERRRTLAGRTGCGLCGTESLEQALPRCERRVAPLALGPGALSRALDAMRARQALQSATGATHAAAWCGARGELRLLREDVGRHNALDKLIGALARERRDAAQGFFAVTSRASYEMVQKTVRAGVGTLAAISAPTALAVHTAQAAGLCLIGFARGRDWVAYSATEQLTLEDLPA
ncbi:formate dehydrogenase accessory sulfurtransferase FdhD [Azohydromonas caseinilytica]|uniref:Sulfur carrier protein FdhD n=1 Tax=Azohydromonas caseinilytica TaxID=2728836 RepID=A0A848FF07_9BURK|nr:formate dehydrogenase accessory sulfurtransferase FdhD [Azohydromonas caseinilytica]NML17872.1 formate dehydrogenase accessory sulfurtransferase FdhD [Azohydromonas caseinilytica]